MRIIDNEECRISKNVFEKYLYFILTFSLVIISNISSWYRILCERLIVTQLV